ncbi:MAG: hypothetical protein ABI091_05320 [Ferruginibacter sp.]
MSDTTTNKGEELYQSKIEEVNKERLYSREEVDDMMEALRYDKFIIGFYVGLFIGVFLFFALWVLFKTYNLVN